MPRYSGVSKTRIQVSAAALWSPTRTSSQAVEIRRFCSKNCFVMPGVRRWLLSCSGLERTRAA